MSPLILDLETVGFDTANADSLSPYKGQIISLGMYDPKRNLGVVYYVSNTPGEEFSDDSYTYKARSEKELLEDFWASAPEYDIFATFNGRAFHLPFLYIRSVALGIRPSVEIARQRYVTKQSSPYHIDLFDEYTFHGSVTKKPSLSVLCDTLGIDNPKLFMSGEDITEAFLAKKIVDIARYNAKDVTAIFKLYEKWFTHLAPKSFINALELP